MKKFLSIIIAFMLCFSYIGNISVFAETKALDIEITVAEDIVGNNFYKDDMPQFTVSIKNVSATAQECEYIAKAVNSNNKQVWSMSDSVNIGAGETMTKEIKVPVEYYGVMTFKIEADANGDTVLAEMPYTLSNHTSDMPHNMKFGTTTHWNRGRGDIDKSIKLMTGAGIGNMRSEDLMWPEFEKKEGEYALTDYQENVLDALSENDIDYMFICNFGNALYHSPVNEPVNDEQGYNALERYIEELLIQSKGRVDYIEVWNEYHSTNMSGSFSSNAEVFAELHKAIYNGVRAGDPSVKVCAFVEDDWGFYETGMITKCLKELDGVKAFDYVSLHPYTDDKVRYFEGDVNSDEFINDVRAELKKYGYSSNTPFIFSELGWTDSGSGETEKAAYIVRASAYNEAHNLAEVVYNYNLMDYYDMGGYGLVNSFDEKHSQEGIPYLGKPAYVAVCYYNGLMADNEFNREIETGIDETYCYDFTDRDGRNILMLGTLEDGNVERGYVNVGKDSVIVADMYGNEKEVSAVEGVISVTLTDEPQYIIGAQRGAEFVEGIETDSSYTAVQTSETSILVSGNTGSMVGGTSYMISVYAPEKSYEDITEASDATNTDVLVWYDYGTTDELGEFEIEFNVDGKSGEYAVYIYSVADESIIEPVQIVKYTNPEDFIKAVLELNEKALEGADAVEAYIAENRTLLGFYTDEFESLDESDVANILTNRILETPLDENNMEETLHIFKQACVASMLNSKAVDNVFDYSEYFADDIANLSDYLAEDSIYPIDKSKQRKITDKAENQDFETIEDMLSQIANAFVLVAIEYPDGVDDLIDILNDFESYTGIDAGDYSKDAINNASGKKYSTMADFESEVQEEEEALEEKKESGSSGGSGGGSGSGKKNSSATQLVQPINPESNAGKEPIPDDVYKDLGSVVWARNSIVALTDKGVLNGKAPYMFYPNDLVTREEFAKMITLAFDITDSETELTFKDVVAGAWYVPYVASAYKAGIVNGYSQSQFGVGDRITRQDMTVMVYNALKSQNRDFTENTEPEFEDAENVAEYAKTAVATLNDLGIVNGKGDNLFDPTGFATRAEAAKIIYSAINLR